jgi:hypothetical protein
LTIALGDSWIGPMRRCQFAKNAGWQCVESVKHLTML